MNTACPFCRKSAPVIYRGLVPTCTACGNVRAPLVHRSLNLAGKPAQVGGAIAHIAGWVVIALGLTVALSVALLAIPLFGTTVAVAIGLPLAVLSLVVGIVLLRSGKALKKSGSSTERATRETAVFAFAAHQGGVVTAREVAERLDMREPDADALLTDLAKTQSERVTLELDDAGLIYFRFVDLDAPRMRVEPWSAGRRADGSPAGERSADVDVELPEEQRRARR